jgi:hypothetical protein
MRRILAATIAIMGLFTAPAGAEQSYPDLKGTWIGAGSGAFVTALQFGRKAVAENVEIKLVVDQQNGKHFTGTVSSSQDAQPFSGVIKSDGTILMSQPSGFIEARLTGEDSIETCYVRISAFSQMATCEELKQQK